MFHLIPLETLATLSLREDILLSMAQLCDHESEYSMQGSVHISLIDDEMMASLNEEYRAKEGTTDVLSFHYFSDFSLQSDTDIVAEIVMSGSRIALQAEEMGHTPEEEFYRLLIHSLLHLVGYDHENDQDYLVMSQKEHTIICSLNSAYHLNIGI